MLAPAALPQSAQDFNRRHGAPYGRRGKKWLRRARDHSTLAARLAGAYAWQPNATTRRFEYPWAYEQVCAQGRDLVVADVGASLGGLQFTLAQAGHDVHAVDPGLAAHGMGWQLDPEFHAFLSRAHHAPVTLHATELENAGLPDDSVDVLVSISTLEHFAPADFSAFAEAAKRVLRPHGIVVLTIDLFLDLQPFTDRHENRYGTNVDVAALLEEMECDLVEGDPTELNGFDAFDPRRVQANLSEYLIADSYPGMAQCIVARRRA